MDLERWFAERRRQIDRSFDFCWPVLPHIFATLLHDGLFSKDGLQGLAQDKLDAIGPIAHS
ncbi:MAG: hypothetical protein ACRD3N_09035 [Terracidiphilus sp.]